MIMLFHRYKITKQMDSMLNCSENCSFSIKTTILEEQFEYISACTKNFQISIIVWNFYKIFWCTKLAHLGSGCGSVGRAVASDTRGPWFESSHWQKFIYVLNICLLPTVYWKDGNKEKEAGNGPFKKKLAHLHTAKQGLLNLCSFPDIPCPSWPHLNNDQLNKKCKDF